MQKKNERKKKKSSRRVKDVQTEEDDGLPVMDGMGVVDTASEKAKIKL